MQVLTLLPALPIGSVQMSLLLYKQAASNLSTHLKNLLFVPSCVDMLKNIWSKFLYQVDSARDLRASV